MFNLEEIKQLISLIDESDIQEFEISKDGEKIHLRKPGKVETVVMQTETTIPSMPEIKNPIQVQPQLNTEQASVNIEGQAVQSQQQDANTHVITSPMVGTFYTAPSPNSPDYVSVGDKVSENTVVCIVEAMKLMNEIEAETKGEVLEILVENGQLVEYGQPLFSIKLS
ncbi:acetyl-CoA carboxylase biotin carboxyl carrier protein [Longirhabdus pacifica]|uniref:acetyl-CoA carboxylase biotin carboxyl carrier protein n=1 Tax=Longirhabdus pacifica TaxID=2305227 RepID=UPI001008DCDF|nr:acetyl-CoA carboxylase biotin carboxyl carrier protein [Longirhabdus pacifica]